MPFESEEPADAAADRLFGGLHALFWLTVRLSESRPLLVVVDDAHLTDPPSAQLLAFLARRVAELPVLLLVAGRPAPGVAEGPLAAVVGSGARLLEPTPLAVSGVAEMLRRAGADPDLAQACLEATGGTPLLVGEVAQALGHEDTSGVPGPERIRLAASRGVARAALAHIAGAGTDAAEFAEALAIADHAEDVGLVATMAGLEPAVAGKVADELAVAGLIEAGPPLQFSHPLIRDAVHDGLPDGRRSELHGRAATVLAARGAAGPAAAHVVESGPGGGEAAIEILRVAARDALAAGDTPGAIRLLERAAAEPPAPETRGTGSPSSARRTTEQEGRRPRTP